MGGGYPIGAICGKADILDLCMEANLGQERYVWFASTLAGNPVSTSASLATLRELRKPGAYERLHALGRNLRDGFRTLLKELKFRSVLRRSSLSGSVAEKRGGGLPHRLQG
jgi:glutamate-1-semialdehyde 2,1-aminomutase